MFTERKEIMIEMRNRIRQEFRTFRKLAALNPAIDTPFFALLARRINEYGIRSSFVYMASRYIQRMAGSDPEKTQPGLQPLFDRQLPFIAEAIITIQYLENQVLDGKHGTLGCGEREKRIRDQKLLAAHYVKDSLYDYIDREVLTDDPAGQALVRRTVRRIFQYVDVGQAMQDEWGTFEHFQTGHGGEIGLSPEIDDFIDTALIDEFLKTIVSTSQLPDRHRNFVRDYLRRVYLTSGALFILLSDLEMQLLEFTAAERNDVLRGAASIGIIGQFINDIADFLPKPTVAKDAGDVFSDIRNDIITLPLAWYFDRHPEWTTTDLRVLTYNERILLQHMAPALRVAMVTSRALRQVARRHFDLDTHEGRLLEDMNSIVEPQASSVVRGLVEKLDALRSLDRRETVSPYAASV